MRNLPRATATSFLLGLALLLAGPAGAADEIKTYELTRAERAPGGATGALVGQIGGKTFLVKSNAPVESSGLQMVSGNVEAEWLASRLLRMAGIDAARTWLIRLKGADGIFSASEFVGISRGDATVIKFWREFAFIGQSGSFADKPAELSEMSRQALRDLVGRIDAAQLRRLQVVDLVMGNGDRHGGNFFLKQGPSQALELFPIDHNFALVDRFQKPDRHATPDQAGWQRNFVRSFDGSSAFSPVGQRAGTVAHILERNLVYWEFVRSNPDVAAYESAVTEVRRAFNDADLERLVERLPEEIPAERKREIVETLKWRRDNVGRALTSYLNDVQAAASGDVRAVLRTRGVELTSAMEEFLLTKMLRRAPGGAHWELDLIEGYYHLRTNGASDAQAKRVLEHAIEVANENAGTRHWDAEGTLKPAIELVESHLAKSLNASGGLSSKVMETVQRAFRSLGNVKLPGMRRNPKDHRQRVENRRVQLARLQDLDARYAGLDEQLRAVRESLATGGLAGDERLANLEKQIELIREQAGVLKEFLKISKDARADINSAYTNALREEILKKAELAELSRKVGELRSALAAERARARDQERAARDARRAQTREARQANLRRLGRAVKHFLLSEGAARRGLPVSEKPAKLDVQTAAKAMEAIRAFFGGGNPEAKLKAMVEEGSGRPRAGGELGQMVRGQLSFLGWQYLVTVFKHVAQAGPQDGSALVSAYHEVTSPEVLAGHAGFAVYHGLAVYKVLPALLRRIPPVAGAVVVSTAASGVVEMFARGETSWQSLADHPVLELQNIVGTVAKRHWREMVIGTAGAIVGGYVGAYVGLPTLGSILGAEAGVAVMHGVDAGVEETRQGAVRGHLGEIARLLEDKRAGRVTDRDFWSGVRGFLSEKILAIDDKIGRYRDELLAAQGVGAADFERLGTALNQLVIEYQTQYESLADYLVEQEITPQLLAVEKAWQNLAARPDQYLLERVATLALYEDHPFVDHRALDSLPGELRGVLPHYVGAGHQLYAITVHDGRGNPLENHRLTTFWEEAERQHDRGRGHLEIQRELNARFDLMDGFAGWGDGPHETYDGWLSDDVQGGRAQGDNALSHFLNDSTASLSIPQHQTPIYGARVVTEHRKMNRLLVELGSLHEQAAGFFEKLVEDVETIERHGGRLNGVFRDNVVQAHSKAVDSVTAQASMYGLYFLGKREEMFGQYVELARTALDRIPERRRIQASYEQVVGGGVPVERTSIYPLLEQRASSAAPERLMTALFSESTSLSLKAKILPLLRAYFIHEVRRHREALQALQADPKTGEDFSKRLQDHLHGIKAAIEGLSHFTDEEARRIAFDSPESVFNLENPIVDSVALNEANKAAFIERLRKARQEGDARAAEVAFLVLARFEDEDEVRIAAMFEDMSYDEVVFVAPHRLPAKEVYLRFLLRVLEQGYRSSAGELIVKADDPLMLANYVRGLYKTWGDEHEQAGPAIRAAVRRLLSTYVFAEDADEAEQSKRLETLLTARAWEQPDTFELQTGIAQEDRTLRTPLHNAVREVRLHFKILQEDWLQLELVKFLDDRFAELEESRRPRGAHLVAAMGFLDETLRRGGHQDTKDAYGQFLMRHLDAVRRFDRYASPTTRKLPWDYLYAVAEFFPRRTPEARRQYVTALLDIVASDDGRGRWSFGETARIILKNGARAMERDIVEVVLAAFQAGGDSGTAAKLLGAAAEALGDGKVLEALLGAAGDAVDPAVLEAALRARYMPEAVLQVWRPGQADPYDPLLEKLSELASVDGAGQAGARLGLLLDVLGSHGTPRREAIEAIVKSGSEKGLDAIFERIASKGWWVSEVIDAARVRGGGDELPARITSRVLALGDAEVLAALPSLTEYVEGLPAGPGRAAAVKLLGERIAQGGEVASELEKRAATRSGLDRDLNGDRPDAASRRAEASLDSVASAGPAQVPGEAHRAGEAVGAALSDTRNPLDGEARSALFGKVLDTASGLRRGFVPQDKSRHGYLDFVERVIAQHAQAWNLDGAHRAKALELLREGKRVTDSAAGAGHLTGSFDRAIEILEGGSGRQVARTPLEDDAPNMEGLELR